jgi:hypothetical protein
VANLTWKFKGGVFRGNAKQLGPHETRHVFDHIHCFTRHFFTRAQGKGAAVASREHPTRRRRS